MQVYKKNNFPRIHIMDKLTWQMEKKHLQTMLKNTKKKPFSSRFYQVTSINFSAIQPTERMKAVMMNAIRFVNCHDLMCSPPQRNNYTGTIQRGKREDENKH